MGDKVMGDRDFYAWITKNVELLRTGNVAEVVLDHIAEELERFWIQVFSQCKRRDNADSYVWFKDLKPIAQLRAPLPSISSGNS